MAVDPVVVATMEGSLEVATVDAKPTFVVSASAAVFSAASLEENVEIVVDAAST